MRLLLRSGVVGLQLMPERSPAPLALSIIKLPDAERAVVEGAKVHDIYSRRSIRLTCSRRAFTAACYHALHWQRLQDDPRLLAWSVDVTLVRTDAFGHHFVGVGVLAALSGRHFPVVTVCLKPYAGAAPRLITAHPHEVG